MRNCDTNEKKHNQSTLYAQEFWMYWRMNAMLDSKITMI